MEYASFTRIAVLILLIAWLMYWSRKEQEAYRELPLRQPVGWYRMVSKVVIYGVFVWIILQLAGVIVIAPMEQPLLIPVGLALVLLGISISVVARRTLGNNWANAYEYQMKQGQKLVTTGIYRYIRHPIYLGMIVFFIGAGMVAQSWLWVSSIAWFIPAYVQAKREEELPFGKAYAAYKKRTRMFIPFIW